MLQPQITPEVFTLFDATALIASIASLVLAVVAIVLALAHKRDADRVNRETGQLLSDVRSETKLITEGVWTELQAYGDAMRGTFIKNQTIEPGEMTAASSSLEFRPPATLTKPAE